MAPFATGEEDMRRILLTTVVALLASGSAHAQEWPTRAVTIIAPFPPGGIIDIAARTVGDALSERWGVPVIVENRAGGSGFIGAQAAAQAEPDGYTFLAAEAGVAIINALLFDSVPYDMAADFIPITTLSNTPIVLAANVASGVTTVEEFIAATRASEHNYSSPFTGSLNHITGEWIALEAGLNLQHIGYRGAAQAVPALASGEVTFGVLAYSSVLPYVQTGDVVIVATTSADRIAADPDLPTLQEGGIPNVDTTQWAGIFAVAGTPEAIVARMHADVTEALASPAVQARFEAVGANVIPQSREDFAAMLDAQREAFARIVEAASITVD
jgi:tripartite-type tricarboxylate transporter receptor subunit TctC